MKTTPRVSLGALAVLVATATVAHHPARANGAAATTVPSRAAAVAPNSFDGAKAFEHLRRVVGFGPRPAGSPALAQTRAYIAAEFRKLGLAVTEQAFVARTPRGPVSMVNLRVILPGAAGARTRIVIGGHYDTKLFTHMTFVGANDAGSSTAFLIEFARVLKDRPRTVPIEIVFFDGEEAVVEWGDTDRTYGSRHYVEAARRARELSVIGAMILVDMVGDRDLRLSRESLSTPWLTDLVWRSARTLGYGGVFVDAQTTIEDDHVPFLDAGIPAVDLIDLEYPPWHTAADTLDQVSARSLEIVGQVLLDALPAIEQRVARHTR